MTLSCICVMDQILPVLCADYGISQPSTQGFQSWQNHCDLKAHLSFTYILLFAQVTPLHGSGLWQQLCWYCSIKMSRKPLPQRKRKKKSFSAFPNTCRNDLVWSSKEGTKCQTAHGRLCRSFWIAHDKTAWKKCESWKRFKTVSKHKALEMFFIFKTHEITENNKMAAKEAINLYQNVTRALLGRCNYCEQLIFFEDYFVLSGSWIFVYMLSDLCTKKWWKLDDVISQDFTHS